MGAAASALPAFWEARPEPLDEPLLTAYLAFTGAPCTAPSIGALAALQRAHLLAIPFETLSPMLGDPVPLDPDALAGKLLSGTRGGYCFEHNLLFAGALSALGYDVQVHAARFLVDAVAPRPRTHIAVRVMLDGRPWLADVGFGRTAFRAPIALDDPAPQAIGDRRFLVSTATGGEVVVSIDDGVGGWEAQYLLEPRPVHRIDCEQLSLWVATDDRSIMRQQLIVLRPLPDGRRAIRGGRLMIDEPGRHVDRALSLGELPQVLRDEFGIKPPAGRELILER